MKGVENKIGAVKDTVMQKTGMGHSHATETGHAARHTTGEVGDSRAMIHHGPGETGQFRGTKDGVVGTEIGHAGMGESEFQGGRTPAGVEGTGVDGGGIENATRPAGQAVQTPSPAAPASTGNAATRL